MCLRVVLSSLLLVLPGAGFVNPASSAVFASSDSARNAVVRVEAAIDPISFGPFLLTDRATDQTRDGFGAEVARRLHIGSSGTGFFVNPDGYLVTNAHVVLSGVRYRGLHYTQAQWDSMTRLLSSIRDVWVSVGEGEGERSYIAQPVAISENLDLAVLRVIRPPGDQKAFNWLPPGNSDDIRIGNPVRALGFAQEGYQDTSGRILSLITGREVHERMNIVRRTDPATGREIINVSGTSPGPVMRLHHDAPVGHGNSGGPLLDARGRVIGVAYALIAERGPVAEDDSAPSGLNLAIASNVLRQFLAGQSVEWKTESRDSAGAHGDAPLQSRISPPAPGAEYWPSMRALPPPDEYSARQTLVDGLRLNGDLAGAYRTAAWLAWLAPRRYSESSQGAGFLRDRGNRDRAAADSQTLAPVIAAADADRRLRDACLRGTIAQQAERLRRDIADMLAEAEAAAADGGRNDPVTRMALAQLGITLDDAITLESAGGAGSSVQVSRESVLRTAATRAAAVAAWLPQAPGPHRSLAIIRGRLASLDGRSELWDEAIAEANRTYELDAADPYLPELLWTLNLRAGHWTEAVTWRARIEAATGPMPMNQ